MVVKSGGGWWQEKSDKRARGGDRDDIAEHPWSSPHFLSYLRARGGDRDDDISERSAERKEQSDKLVKNYKHFQDKLLQATQGNRSISLKKIYHKRSFDLTALEKIKEGTIEKIVSQAIKNINAAANGKKDEGASQNILLDSKSGDDADSARYKLKTLSRNLTQIEEETGSQAGYFGFPFLQGHVNPDFYVRGPIVLFPISLEYRKMARNGGWFLHLIDKRPILNGALITALKRKGGWQFEKDYEDAFDELIEGLPITKEEDIEKYFFNKLNDWVKTIITIDETKNQTQTLPLYSLSKSSIEDLEEQKLHLENYKIIGNFPQADSEIYNDYNTLIENADPFNVGVIGDLMGIEGSNPESPDSDDSPIDIDGSKDKELNSVLESDSSQDEVMLESKKSNLVVVRGPPGTGKSQVIVNLISDALANNKRVLVACQKRAALEVVRQRLGQVKLDRYVVFLEKETDDRVKMYRQLRGIIEEEPRPRPYFEETVDGISAKIDHCVKYLSSFGSAMRDQSINGISAHELYSVADGQYEPVLDLSLTDLDLVSADLDAYIQKIKNVEDEFKKFEDENHPWFGREDFSAQDTIKKSQLKNLLQELIDLSSKCMLASNPRDQSELVSHFDKYLKSTGFKKLWRSQSSKKIKEILGIEKVTESFVSGNFNKIKTGVEFLGTFSKLLEFFKRKKRDELQSMVADPTYLATYLSKMHKSLDFDTMQEFDKRKREYEKSIFQILDQARNRFSIDDEWATKIKQEIYVYWLAKIENSYPILKGNPVPQYQEKKHYLKALLEEKQQLIMRTIQRHIDNVVDPRRIGSGKRINLEDREWKALKMELTKKRRIMPIRKLLQRHSSRIFQIAPCWLASPESVSKIFPLKRNLFDLVVVDEASQLAVERAIPLLYRAKHAVIAGDEKQLPPFDLFQIREEDELEEDEIVSDEKSLLDLARSMHRVINLSWHYRSQYQDLINFSNHAFYEGCLNIVPNATSNPQSPPIRWAPCNGTWENQKNPVEAEMVVEEIGNVLRDKFKQENSYPSIGVITFNEKQQELIRNAIDCKKESDHEFLELYRSAFDGRKKDDSLFVKNIENVQGDERDIILFSVGYAKNSDGKVVNRFGTLSTKGGENRLNVAITRARKGMVVVSSIDPTDIKPTSRHDGPKRLRQFLEYAKKTSSLDELGQKAVLADINPDMERSREAGSAEFDSEFEVQVCRELRARGYKVKTQVGFSGYRIDLAIVHPTEENKYILAVECDGATFHSAKSVRERDVMRQKFLEGKGWKVERIWSRNWWKNPKREIDRIDCRIKEISGDYS